MVAIFERLLPTAWAPTIGWAVSCATIAGIAAFIATDRIPVRSPVRFAAATWLVLLPNVDTPLGSITYLQFYLGVFIAAGVIARGPLGAPILAALAVASLSGPIGLLLAPLYLARVRVVQDFDAFLRLAAVGIPASIQAAFLVASGRSSSATSIDLETALRVLGIHMDVAVFGGTWISAAQRLQPPGWIGVVATIGLGALVVAALMRSDRRALLIASYIIASVSVSAVLFGGEGVSTMLDASSGARYYLLPTFVLGGLALEQADRGHKAAVALVGLFMIGVVGDARLQHRPDLQWAERSACIGGADPCVVPVHPGGEWNIVWPGRELSN